MLSFSKWKEENRKYEEIQRKTEVKTYASGNYDFNVDLTVGKTINYNGYQTHQYSLSDGTVVYCLEPSKANPSNGQYTASVSNDALLSAVATMDMVDRDMKVIRVCITCCRRMFVLMLM